jgi:hypothetical protein
MTWTRATAEAKASLTACSFCERFCNSSTDATIEHRRDHREIVADAMVQFIWENFCRSFSSYGLFERVSHRLADTCEGKTDEHEQKEGQKIFRGEEPPLGARKHCKAQRGAEGGWRKSQNHDQRRQRPRSPPLRRLSCAASAIWARSSAWVGVPMRSNRRDRMQRTRLVLSGP